MRQLRVLVVEDSLVFRELLVKSLNNDPAITVVGTANDPFEARDKIIELKPDVMTLDVELPKMSGIEFLRKLIPQYPMPVLVISALNDKVFDALSAGAVDFVAKPTITDREQLDLFLTKELPVKVKIASTAKISNIKKTSKETEIQDVGVQDKSALIAIGASTGGTEAIYNVIKEFGPDIPGIVLVQHMPAGFTSMYANRLNDQCRVKVKEAEDGDVVKRGQVLIAPGGDRQMTLVKTPSGGYAVKLTKGPKVSGHCPSVDALFDSVAKIKPTNTIGIILTGMGGDGAKGLLEMRKAGARTIGQDESTCVVYGMPKVAYDMGAVEFQEKLSDIPKRTYQILSKM